MAKLVTMNKISLRDSKDVNEKMIQEYIFDDPSCLGLGDLTALRMEKKQIAGGRLDLLLEDEGKTRYAMEIQLGETDPSHIIRTIEYWDNERKRNRSFNHIAVIVAEEITGRFMNVIQLFNGSIPIIALQLTAYDMGSGEFALAFTKVLDYVPPEDEDMEAYEATDRKYWEGRSTPEQLKVMDGIFENCDPLNGFELKYNKFYIGLTKNGIASNPVRFQPRKKFVYIIFTHIKDDEVYGEQLDTAGLSYDYFAGNGELRVRINKVKEYTDNKELVDKIAAEAVENKG